MEKVLEAWRNIHGVRDTDLVPEDALFPAQIVQEAKVYTSLYTREVYDEGLGSVEVWEERITLEGGEEAWVRTIRTRYGVTIDKTEAKGVCGQYRLRCVGGIHYLSPRHS